MSESSPRRSARFSAPRPVDGGALLVTGSLGIGKTRVLEAVLAEAEELGFHTLRGAAQEEEGRTPYAPLVEALDPLAARRPELTGALTDSAQVALSRLLPSVRTPARAAEEPVDRRRVFCGGRCSCWRWPPRSAVWCWRSMT